MASHPQELESLLAELEEAEYELLQAEQLPSGLDFLRKGPQPEEDHQAHRIRGGLVGTTVNELGSLTLSSHPNAAVERVWKDMRNAEMLMDNVEIKVNGVLSRIDALLTSVCEPEETSVHNAAVTRDLSEAIENERKPETECEADARR